MKDISDKIGTVDEFHSKKCFELYIYALGFAKQINSYIDAGYLVFNDNEHFKNKFVFYGVDKPHIAEKSGNCSFVYLGSSFDKNGKVWILGEDTKRTIKKMFSNFKFVNPKNIECIKI